MSFSALFPIKHYNVICPSCSEPVDKSAQIEAIYNELIRIVDHKDYPLGEEWKGGNFETYLNCDECYTDFKVFVLINYSFETYEDKKPSRKL